MAFSQVHRYAQGNDVLKQTDMHKQIDVHKYIDVLKQIDVHKLYYNACEGTDRMNNHEFMLQGTAWQGMVWLGVARHGTVYK